MNSQTADNGSIAHSSASLKGAVVRQLLVRIAGGDEAAFRTFFDAYRLRFFKAVLKMTGSETAAEEIVQEVFMQVWHKKESLTTIEHPDSYFFTAVYRRVYRYYKEEARQSSLYQTLREVDKPIGNTTEEMVIASESDRLILEAIEKLPAQQKQIYTMSKRQGMSRDEISEKLHISPNTVRNHLYQAIKFIKAHMGASYLSAFLFYWLLEK